MSHKQAHQLTVSVEWARHLRPRLRREFWKGERRAYRKHAADEAARLSRGDGDDAPAPAAGARRAGGG
jgi:hypothetical protein